MKLQGIELHVLAALLSLAAISKPSEAESRDFEVEELAPGVHVAIRPRPLEHPVDGNVTILVGAEDVIVVDSGRTPSSAKEAIEIVRKLTPLPVRYLVNTHWHGDHQHGNAAYVEAFPGIQIVSQRATREDMETLGEQSLQGQIRLFSDRAALQRWLDSGLDREGRPLVEAQKHRLRQLLSVPEDHLRELRNVRITLPSLTFDRELDLYQGDREVRIFSNGAGNTRGDAVVYLPRERIVVTGDLLVSTIPFMSMSYPRNWLARLDEIAALDPDVIVPGHGPVQKDLSVLDRHRALLRSLVEQSDRAVSSGASLEEAVANVDLSRFRAEYSNGDPFLADEFDYRVTLDAPRDAYLEATSSRARGLSSAVTAEASRLEQLIPEEKQTGFLANDLKAALSDLAPIPAVVSSGRVYLAFRKLSSQQEMVESAAFWYEHEPAVQDPALFDALWERTAPEIEIENVVEPGALDGKSAVVRAHAEIAMNRAEPHYRGSRLYAKAGQQAGGLYYLGSARAAVDFVRFCARIPDEREGDLPDLTGLEAIESELTRETLDAYAESGAAIAHHRDFIRVDSALKEARELLHEHRRFGAAESLLEARLRLGVESAAPGTVADFESVSYRARLFDPNHDHSLARELWERALEASHSTDEPDRRLAAVIVTQVIPFYFERFTGSPRPPETSQ